jgi:hypothetical protein
MLEKSRFENVLNAASLEVPEEFQTSTFKVSTAPLDAGSLVKILNQKLTLTVAPSEGTVNVWNRTSFALLEPPSRACHPPDRASLSELTISAPVALCSLHTLRPCSKPLLAIPTETVPAAFCVTVNSSRPIVSVAVRSVEEVFAAAA